MTSIGSSAFSGCTGLTSIEIPNSVTSIGDDAFYNCSNLTQVTLNSNAIVSKTYTSSSNFSSIFGSQVEKYILGDDIISIGAYAFYNSSRLTSFEIPNSVTSIGTSAFYGCTGLEKVVAGNITNWCGFSFENKEDNPLFYAQHIYSDEDTEITRLIIPNDVTDIGQYTFYGCSDITRIYFTGDVRKIGANAFYSEVTNIRRIYCAMEEPYAIYGSSLSTRVFHEDVYANARLYVPQGTLVDYQATQGWADFQHIEEMTDEMTGIDTIDNAEESKDLDNPANTFYSLDGRKVEKLYRGVNIVRRPDGTVRKVVVK